jgi:hypothetical protein
MGIRSEEMFKSIPKYLVPKPFDQVWQNVKRDVLVRAETAPPMVPIMKDITPLSLADPFLRHAGKAQAHLSQGPNRDRPHGLRRVYEDRPCSAKGRS